MPKHATSTQDRIFRSMISCKDHYPGIFAVSGRPNRR